MPNLHPVFNPLTAPLSGVNLIEAGAGTGKTYTITSLVLRLLLQTDMGIHQILVVTFTEAATAELRGRLYQRLSTALQFLENPAAVTDVDPLLQTLLAQETDKTQIVNRLQQALYGFDEAAIFTIHGFCRRVLQEHAFESGVQFDTELIKDPAPLLKEIVADCWRKNFYYPDSLPIKNAIKQYILDKYKATKLFKLVSTYSSHAFLHLNPPKTAIDWGKLNQQYLDQQHSLVELQRIWDIEKTEIEALITAALAEKQLSGRSYKIKKMPEHYQILENYLEQQNISIDLPDCFSLFCQDEMKVNNNKTRPQNPFFKAAQIYKDHQVDMQKLFADGLLNWQHDAFEYCQIQSEKRMKKQGQQVFNDLLKDLYKALRGNAKTALTERLQQRYHAALIDEFQDTDMLQYHIFWDLFAAPARQQETLRSLFFIGDPKQAIYAFRGADILTYIKAVKQVDRRYTLTTNWRSQAHLLTAINTIFKQHDNPFQLEEIQYHPLIAAQAADDNNKQALHIHYLDREILGYDTNIAIKTGELEPRIPYLLTQEILQQLKQDSALKSGDIAVLVPNNQQAIAIQKALQKYQLPTVLHSKQSIFKSHEAIEMQFILNAIIDPQNEDGLRAALSTDLLGLSANDLEQLSQNTLAWETWLLKFRHYQQLWKQRGFHLMTHQLMQDFNISVQLLNRPDGERRLTNMRHLIEVLQQAPPQQLRKLLYWLHERCELVDQESDTYLLRLESDNQAITISTIHHSKGLQYPVVFLPYAWKGLNDIATVPFSYHKIENTAAIDKVYLQLNENEAAKAIKITEQKAESLRLFYVALTRSESRCHLFFGSNTYKHNALEYLLKLKYDQKLSNDKDIINTLKTQLNSAEILIAPLQLHQHPVYHGNKPIINALQARRFKRRLQLPWQIISFSALLKQQRGHQFDARSQAAGVDALYHSSHVNHHDRYEIMTEADNAAFSVHMKLPASPHMGNLLHEILQYLDFQKPNYEPIKKRLQTYGYDSNLETDIIVLLEAVLQTPLNKTADLSLAALKSAHRLNEVEFFYPLNRLNADAFNQLLQSYPLAQHSANLQFKDLQGFMRGFIDLIFYWQGKYYILDYKSNRLGFSIDDYQQQQLTEAMQHHHYVLQYLIYSVALQQYLQNRIEDYDYQQHFGGIYYLFLRGMQPQLGAEYGVFFDKPPASFIEQLSRLLTSKEPI